MKRINSCRVCESPDILEFLDLGEQPYANSLLKNPDEKENFYPLSLSWCSDCNLVQLNHTAEPKDLFSNYFWVTGTSSTARKQSNVFYNEVLSHTQNLKNLNKSYILEVGSNDGTFLIPFIQNNYKVLGVDPAQNIVKEAIAKGVPTKCGFFGVKTAKEILKETGPAKVVMARNVLPHVANTHDFVKGLKMCLEEDGLLMLEVHYAKKICEELQYDSIYHEHLCYFTLKSLEKLLERNNLFVHDIGESPISGGSIIAYAKKKKIGNSANVNKYREFEDRTRINKLDSWEKFANKTKSHREKLINILTNTTKEDGPLMGYGASARSSTLLNYCDIGTQFVSGIADQNPLKHGYYTAGTHIPIDHPDHIMKKNPKNILMLAWNFSEEIINRLKSKYNYKGKYILPLPHNPKIINTSK